MKCDVSDCTADAESHVQWGTEAAQQGHLCHEHIRDVWDQSHHASVTGIWIQRPIKA